ncbi:MAG TPA: sugar ABC transporter substrate-binding protein [Candidatus Merdenecus merdavium]|nr:sugar ABC transporter substrate-binding protein [Candidatus Merdenecus merdavium]
MKRKKVIVLVLAVVMMTTLFSSCGKKDSIDKSENSSEPLTLQWWGSFPEDMGPNQVCEEFNKIDPNVQVEYTRFVNDEAGNTKVDVSLMSDNTIDVFLSLDDVNFQKRIDSGFAYPLDELFDEVGFSLEENYDDTISQTEINDHYYGLPAKKLSHVILYNQEMFDEADVAYPSEDWTYDEFLDTAKKLTKGEGTNKVYGYFFPGYDSGQPATSMLIGKLGSDWMYAEDGQTANINNKDLKYVTEKYLERVKEGIEPSYVDVTTEKMAPESMLLTGRAAMVFGDWIVRDVKDTENYPHDFKVGFANMPRIEGQTENLNTCYSDLMSVNSKSEHPVESMKFIKWYIEEGMDYVAPFGRIPASKKYDDEKVTSLLFGGQEELFDMESARSVYFAGTDFSTRTNLTAAIEINTILTEEFDKAFAGVQSVDETLEKAQKRADEKIEKTK